MVGFTSISGGIVTNKAAIYADTLELTRLGKKLEGSTPVKSFARLVQGLPEQPETNAKWMLQGFKDDLDQSFIDVSVNAAPVVVCQRCMGSFAFELNTSSRLKVVKSESDLNQPEYEDVSPEEWDEPLLATSRLDVLELIEDELILALPFAPKHESCSSEALDKAQSLNDGLTDLDKSPFSVLSQLRKK